MRDDENMKVEPAVQWEYRESLWLWLPPLLDKWLQLTSESDYPEVSTKAMIWYRETGECTPVIQDHPSSWVQTWDDYSQMWKLVECKWGNKISSAKASILEMVSSDLSEFSGFIMFWLYTLPDATISHEVSHFKLSANSHNHVTCIHAPSGIIWPGYDGDSTTHCPSTWILIGWRRVWFVHHDN